MKIIGLDVETTGTDPNINQIIQVALVAFEMTMHADVVPVQDLPYLFLNIENREYVFSHDELEALFMNVENLRAIHEGNNIVSPSDVGKLIHNFITSWFKDDDSFTIIGKNVAQFDWQFLKGHSWLNDEPISKRIRFIDPTVLFMNPYQDSGVITSQTLYDRAGLNKPVKHNALDDARSMVEIYRIGISRLLEPSTSSGTQLGDREDETILKIALEEGDPS